jgi:ADP-heptose:LPS heptosyltransferase
MKVSKQLFLDKFVLAPVILLLNVTIRFAGIIFKPRHNLQENFKTIVVCKYKGMGSIVQSSVLLQNLRMQYPSAKIVFVSTSANKALLDLYPFLDTQILLDDSGIGKLIKSFPSFWYKIAKLRPDIFYDLEIYSNFSSLMVGLSFAKNRVGFYLRSSHFKHGIYSHQLFFNTTAPIHQAYMQMFRLTGNNSKCNSLYGFDSIKNDFDAILQKYKVSKSSYILINPNASDLRIERRWPLENFKNLMQKILLHYPEYDIVIIGSKGEMQYADQLIDEANPKIKSVAGKTSLKELISLIASSKVMVTNDTGPMHLAFSTQTRTLALFGPSKPEQFDYFIKGKSIYKQVYCSPCVHEFQIPPCKGENVCMQKILVEEAFSELTTLLENEINFESKSKQFDYTLSNALPLGLVYRP